MSEAGVGSEIKLIALDLDGTTLTSSREIHPTNAAAIAAAQAQGITVVLASGRIRPSMAPFARQLELGGGPLICSNGAHIVDRGGGTLEEHHLGRTEQDAILDFATFEGLHVNGYTTDRMFYLADSPWIELYRNRARTIPMQRVELDELRGMQLIKLMFIAEPARIRSLAQEVGDWLKSDQVAVTESEPEYLELLPRSANKGVALKRLAGHLGIARAQVMAVGDYLNDVEMVEWAGYGVAMGNAVEEVKAVARQVVAINDDGGVGEAINSVLQ